MIWWEKFRVEDVKGAWLLRIELGPDSWRKKGLRG